MKKEYLKKFFIIIFLIIICISNYTCVYSRDFQQEYQYKAPIEPGELTGGGGNTGEIVEVGTGILSVVSIVASAISIIAMIALGIKYMMGSVEERASYKKTLLPYFIGAIFVFGASTIPGIVYNMFN